MLEIKHLPVDDITDDDIEKDMNDFKKYYDNLSKDLSSHKTNFNSHKVDSDRIMPKVDVNSLLKNNMALLIPNKGSDLEADKKEEVKLSDQRNIAMEFDQKLHINQSKKKDQRLFATPKSRSENFLSNTDSIHKNDLKNTPRNKNGISNLLQEDNSSNDRKGYSVQSSNVLIPDTYDKSKNIKKGKEGQTLSTSYINSYGKEIHIESKENDLKVDSQTKLDDSYKKGKNLVKTELLDQHEQQNIKEQTIDDNNDDLEKLINNLNGELNSIKKTQHNDTKSQLSKNSKLRKSNFKKQTDKSLNDEYNNMLQDYDAVENLENGVASLGKMDSVVGQMAAFERGEHRNNTVYEIKDEGMDTVDIPETRPFLARIHGDRAIITAGCVVGGIGLLLIVAALLMVWVQRRRERRDGDRNNNRGYQQLGSARERRLLTADHYSLFGDTSSDDGEWSGEEEASFINP